MNLFLLAWQLLTLVKKGRAQAGAKVYDNLFPATQKSSIGRHRLICGARFFPNGIKRL